MENELKTKFIELIRSSYPKKKRKNKSEILENLREEIKEARRLGYSFKEISEFLAKSGTPVPSHQVQSFCRNVLKEKPRFKKVKKVDKKIDQTLKESPQVKVEGSKKNVQMPNPQASINLVEDRTSQKKTLPPGFRVPTDEF